MAFTTSAFSYKTLAVGLLPLFEKAGGGALVTLDFDNSTQAMQSQANFTVKDPLTGKAIGAVTVGFNVDAL